ncbi:DUF4082 domain-containing protein [Nonomuraea sp. NPDC005501]|uniref:DUF4082 domain-containing protein n=1 Tax=Nonomuraea sp. NPDC005501 TaxID=3156884 RepID=UPI0033BB25D5
MGGIVVLQDAAYADPLPVSIGTADSYGVLAGSSVTNSNQTTVAGDLGVSPGSTVSGFPPGTVTGSVHAGDSAAAQARSDAVAAYNELAGRSPDATIATQLGGTTRSPGVYNSTSGTFALSGTLTLDAQNDPDAVFVFQASSLTTANVSNIDLAGGAQADNVFWQISGSTTLGTQSTFRGDVLGQGSVTVSSGAAVYGRVFSLNNTVALQGTTSGPATRVTVPDDPKSTTSVSSSLNPSRTGDSVTFTATVRGVGVMSSIVPVGQVVFKDYDTVIGSDTNSSLAPATLTVSDLRAGEHRITAVYLGGDTPVNEAIVHFAPSKSQQLIQLVTYTIWNDSDTPAVSSHTETQPVTLGVKFQATTTGVVSGIRFYKGSLNTGTHTGSLWTAGGTLLASATFSNETASGWQQMDFATPVTVTANTTYVASYHTPSGHFSYTLQYFTSQHASPPLVALADGAAGGNGVYTYGATSAFPSSTFQSTNYWVDVVFTPASSLWDQSATPAVASHSDTQAVTLGVRFRAATTGLVRGIRFYKGSLNTGTHTGALWTAGGTLLASATFSNETASGWQQVNFSTPVAVSANTTYVASYHTTSGRYSITGNYFTSARVNRPLTAFADSSGGNGVYTYGASNSFPTSSFQATNYWVDVVFTPSNSLWGRTAVPAVTSNPATQAVTLGVKFQALRSGSITGLRFYKSPLDIGTHTGALWTSGGTQLGSVTFSGETAFGWQEATLSSPVAISANTTYVASYHTTSGHFAYTLQYFTDEHTSGPLVALENGTDGGNGVYTYGASSTFPSSTYQSTNYWADVVFNVT